MAYDDFKVYGDIFASAVDDVTVDWRALCDKYKDEKRTGRGPDVRTISAAVEYENANLSALLLEAEANASESNFAYYEMILERENIPVETAFEDMPYYVAEKMPEYYGSIDGLREEARQKLQECKDSIRSFYEDVYERRQYIEEKTLDFLGDEYREYAKERFDELVTRVTEKGMQTAQAKAVSDLSFSGVDYSLSKSPDKDKSLEHDGKDVVHDKVSEKEDIVSVFPDYNSVENGRSNFDFDFDEHDYEDDEDEDDGIGYNGHGDAGDD